ncbi:SAM-dependent methyltransferase [Paenibacillus sp. J5C_2022]|uniref:class I SAM-dependent methyltransferase n=1 Tax=Paenibacillus sp. J5C2022 TaxID=2977129 RepID=UPI0021CFF3FA|nr:class I SAM-dependent methyltransferase [Paenibacillus sp. J5C2022]MCU6711754.1 SAM-dependent methyltransferase [Paenibacillus sp. J5C2022]
MKVLHDIRHELVEYSKRLSRLAEQGSASHIEELEAVISDYSGFVTNQSNKEAWNGFEELDSDSFQTILHALRTDSARCVAIMEKNRAIKLLDEADAKSSYFQNIEACILQEFRHFNVTAESNVLLVGSGAFPMTPLHIARQTGASVVGIDIDDEAVSLGRQVVARLGPELSIRLERATIEELDGMDTITHVVFSSTVKEKYRILDRLYDLTRGEVAVAMRFGDRLKSIFNYPSEDVDKRKWKVEGTHLQQELVFDIIYYRRV